MDKNRADGSLRDEIGLAIEASMAVEPAPELQVLVRARIDRERATAGRWTAMPWRLAGVGALVVVVAALAFTPWRDGPAQTAPTPEIATLHVTTVVPLVTAVRSTPPQVGRQAVRNPATSAAVPNEAAILRAYVDHIRQHPIDPSVISAVESPAKPLVLSAIGIEQIAIKPLPKLPAITGESQ